MEVEVWLHGVYHIYVDEHLTEDVIELIAPGSGHFADVYHALETVLPRLKVVILIIEQAEGPLHSVLEVAHSVVLEGQSVPFL